jgi:hypothetical protein
MVVSTTVKVPFKCVEKETEAKIDNNRELCFARNRAGNSYQRIGQRTHSAGARSKCQRSITFPLLTLLSVDQPLRPQPGANLGHTTHYLPQNTNVISCLTLLCIHSPDPCHRFESAARIASTKPRSMPSRVVPSTKSIKHAQTTSVPIRSKHFCRQPGIRRNVTVAGLLHWEQMGRVVRQLTCNPSFSRPVLG